ncbi:MAG: hypothetical protein IPP34_07505 [Bacteroidetes bacterium]|nr:hypothetical protein [Bacteroidota bacterium]MBK7968389.1 hypothetical protein [Bacteroidota bacterium]MBK8413997.1 hypothetical protein [Bacteroidota bacterium]MBK9047836.1 hypothetical protein [Bacteroidota bacterium]MBK9424405.1 hypothetical protein [Bacteroidota bacterium]
MKNTDYLPAFLLILLGTFLSSCDAIAGIFQAGMGFGIFIVIAVLVLIVGLVMKIGKK